MMRQVAAKGLVIAFVIMIGMCGSVTQSFGLTLPEGLVVLDKFKSGLGVPIGKIQRVKGETVIIHVESDQEGYRAGAGLFLYRGDTIITLEKSKIRFKLNDGSVLSLASETRLKLNKSVYDKKKKSRSSFLNMTFGKARFLVVKLLNFKRSEFKVKTPTAVCGVRGSDFVIEATAEVTRTTAFEGTELEIISLVDPDAEPTVLKDFETSKVYLGEYPTDPVRLPDDEIEQMKEVFISVSPEAGKSEGTDDEGEGDSQEEGSETDADDASAVVDEVPVLVSDDDIGELPDTMEMMEVEETSSIVENIEREGVDMDKEGSSLVQSEIVEQVKGDFTEIPDFPQMPE